MSQMIEKIKGFFSGVTLTLIGGLILCFIVYYNFIAAPDKRTVPERIDDAMGELHKGADKAGRQFKDRTPAEKLNDAAKDLKKDLN